MEGCEILSLGFELGHEWCGAQLPCPCVQADGRLGCNLFFRSVLAAVRPGSYNFLHVFSISLLTGLIGHNKCTLCSLCNMQEAPDFSIGAKSMYFFDKTTEASKGYRVQVTQQSIVGMHNYLLTTYLCAVTMSRLLLV